MTLHGVSICAGVIVVACGVWAAPLRDYDFARAEENGVVRNASDERGALRFRAIDEDPAWRVADGALVLQSGVFEGERVEEARGGVALALWVKLLGPGAHRGNDGIENGMLVCNGSGYYDGWRVMVEPPPQRRVRVEFGRAQGAFGVASMEGLRTNEWNLITARWDGKTLSLGVNGFHSARAAWDGEGYVPAQNDLRVGYAGFGVGEVEMALRRLQIFDGAVSMAELNANATEVIEAQGRRLEEKMSARGVAEVVPRHEPYLAFKVPPIAENADCFFVAPDGNDANAGTMAAPLATWQGARDAVRAARQRGAWQGGGVVWFRGGTYAMRSTVMLSREDSGVAYCAWQDERPVFSGGEVMQNFKAATNPRLPEAARHHVRVATLAGELAAESYGFGVWKERVFEVYENGEPLQPARWPNEGWVRTGDVVGDDGKSFRFDVARWTDARGMMAHGYWHFLWADSVLPVSAADGVLTLGEAPAYGVAAGQPFYVMNVIEELDAPGEWFLDRETGRLYVWPRGTGKIVATRMRDVFVRTQDVEDVRLEGLCFEYGQEGGLVFEGGKNVIVSKCEVRRLGGSALRVEGTTGFRICGNAFHTLGHKGIFVNSGDRRALRSSDGLIEDNAVWNFGRCSRTYQPAVQLEGCGTRVSHNWFHDGASSAMRVEGNDHEIAYNLFERVVLESDDQGAVDMWGDPSYRGVVFRGNVFRDIGADGEAPCGRGGIRLDDGICGVAIIGNLFERASVGGFGGVQIHGGNANVVADNVFRDCRYGVSFSPWPTERWRNFLRSDEVRAKLYERVDVRSEIYRKRYPALAWMEADDNVNYVLRNIFAGGEQMFVHCPAAVETFGNEVVSESPDVSPWQRAGRLSRE